MKRAATLLVLAVLLAFSAGRMSASTGTTLPLKAASADSIKPVPPTPAAPPNTILNFTVNDAHGVLLTCAKQQVDTDTLSGCTLAPGRSLDDLMTSIVQTIRAQQKAANDEK
jgi:hypothetical protein